MAAHFPQPTTLGGRCLTNTILDSPVPIRPFVLSSLILAATDLRFQLQWSDDLVIWPETGVTDSLIDAGASTETREAKVPLGDLDPNHAFVRLRVK